MSGLAYVLGIVFAAFLKMLLPVGLKGLVFLLCVIFGMLILKWEHGEEHPDAIDYKSVDISTSSGFNLASMVIILMLAGRYIIWRQKSQQIFACKKLMLIQVNIPANSRTVVL